jgi:hypothetical protein
VITGAAFFRRMAGFFAAGAFDVFDSVRFAGILSTPFNVNERTE